MMARLSVKIPSPGRENFGPKAARLMRWFGLDRLDVQEHLAACSASCTVEIGPGRICLITGPSGTGKTLLLRQFYKAAPRKARLWLEDIPLESDRCVADCMDQPLEETVRCFSAMGLGDVFALLVPPCRLSTGQQYRYRLVRAMLSRRRWLFADEFGAALDGPGTAALAVQTAAIVRRSRRILFAAAAREELADYLQPDILIQKGPGGQTEIQNPYPERT